MIISKSEQEKIHSSYCVYMFVCSLELIGYFRIKGVGGAVNGIIPSNEPGLIRWELCGHELTALISNSEDDLRNDETIKVKKHHEDTSLK